VNPSGAFSDYAKREIVERWRAKLEESSKRYQAPADEYKGLLEGKTSGKSISPDNARVGDARQSASDARAS
jgi:hypothetical protein